MTTSKFLRHAAAAAAAVVILGTFQGPSDPSNRLSFCGLNAGYIWAVEAGDSNGLDGEDGPSDLTGGDGEGPEPGRSENGDEKDSSTGQVNGEGEPVVCGLNAGYIWAVEAGDSNGLDGEEGSGDLTGGDGEGPEPGRSENGDEKDSSTGQVNGEGEPVVGDDSSIKTKATASDDSKKQNKLRGSASTNKSSSSEQSKDPLLEKIFGAFTGLGTIILLLVKPKYQGALECLNEKIYRDVLSGPKKVKDNPQLLQQAYSVLRRPPPVLQVPELFVELRQETDKRLWEQRRKREIRFYEQKGEPIPDRLQLSADEVMAADAEDPPLREEHLSETELASRTVLIDGWMKEQFRLRLYYSKRIGVLKGDPQELVETFNPGPKYVTVSVEEILGLSYDAKLDPEPEIEASSPEQRSSARAAEF
ncbi:uncharacterized protein EMH_0042040 [Eimeria mitis]|uniref:Uncharacterized protein n=1 Tax=Eimeria mitis TaxID=44415 RepID=U6JYG8_9EIME|nr:uncharacterized protein EMH_0042040 [Eimeria mitis]CDJ28568.1 hypothetical protein, conserved [Eimeria mitis]